MREYRLMREAIESFELDLGGRVVLTEAATNAYTWTPLLAALAGAARVFAVTADSVFASAGEVERATNAHADALEVRNRVEVIRDKRPEDLAIVDIVTNLGFVRPIDAGMVGHLKRGAVVSLMWEPWEFREGDIDLEACRGHGVAVLGTNEADARLETVKYVGLTVLKLLLSHGVEVRGSRILLLGAGRFVDAARACLVSLGAVVEQLARGGDGPRGIFDAAVCLEHEDRDLLLVGRGGLLGDHVATDRVGLIVHVCGKVDPAFAAARGWHLVPPDPAAPGHMSFATDYVGPRPVINLHAAGLRVAQAYLENEPSVLASLALAMYDPRHARTTR